MTNQSVLFQTARPIKTTHTFILVNYVIYTYLTIIGSFKIAGLTLSGH